VYTNEELKSEIAKIASIFAPLEIETILEDVNRFQKCGGKVLFEPVDAAQRTKKSPNLWNSSILPDFIERYFVLHLSRGAEPITNPAPSIGCNKAGDFRKSKNLQYHCNLVGVD
jgi:hypothetical protein